MSEIKKGPGKTGVPRQAPKNRAADLSPARKAAFEILQAVERGQTHSDELLRGRAVEGLSAADRNLATALVLGVLRWQIQLDRALQGLLSRPNAKLVTEVRIALRLVYFYHKNGVTLKKGDRASFSLLKMSAPYEHIYQWEIPDSMNVDDRGYRLNQQSAPENQVWHVLRLENTSQQPWTTAPAFALNGTLPVAQDTLGYTPPGGRSFLKLTVATDVRAEQSQTETTRTQVNIAGRNYDEVTVAGKLKLTNWKSTEINMLVRKSIVGEVLESPDGKATKVARNLTSVNSNSEIEWEFKLPAGKDRELPYQYKVLISR